MTNSLMILCIIKKNILELVVKRILDFLRRIHFQCNAVVECKIVKKLFLLKNMIKKDLALWI